VKVKLEGNKESFDELQFKNDVASVLEIPVYLITITGNLNLKCNHFIDIFLRCPRRKCHRLHDNSRCKFRRGFESAG
jgi:hypothetical protein